MARNKVEAIAIAQNAKDAAAAGLAKRARDAALIAAETAAGARFVAETDARTDEANAEATAAAMVFGETARGARRSRPSEDDKTVEIGRRSRVVGLRGIRTERIAGDADSATDWRESLSRRGR